MHCKSSAITKFKKKTLANSGIVWLCFKCILQSDRIVGGKKVENPLGWMVYVFFIGKSNS